MRILASRRQETMGQLARELGVTDRTIRNDITALTADYPLVTVRGNGGCVRLEDWYQPHKNILNQRQQVVLMEILNGINEPYQKKVLQEMLTAFGSPLIQEKF